MIKKFSKTILQHKIIALIAVIIIAGGSYYGYKTFKGDGVGTRYVSAAVEKGTIIISVSGSGQVSALDQVDIKPKVSGEIAAIYIQKDQEIKTGDLLATLDAKDIKKTVTNAEIALDNAKNDLEDAKENYQAIITDSEKSLVTAYDDGYTTLSTTFLDLANYVQDLKDVAGTDKSPLEYINEYTLLLGSNSSFVQRFLDDYTKATDSYNQNLTSFTGLYRDAGRDAIYNMIDSTLETTKIISQALESARHMYGAAVTVQNYKYFHISSYIDKMLSKIESDIPSIYSDINSIQKIKDTIDDINTNTPKDIRDAQLTIQSSQNNVLQKEDDLSDAKEQLAEHFISAPFSGIIASVSSSVKKGDSVSGSTVLATLITKQQTAEISVNEVDVVKIKVGQKATVTFDAIEGLSLTAKVTEIDTIGTISQGVVTYDVKIIFDTQDERVKPGMSVSAAVITDMKQDILLVPNSAVKTNGGTYVEILVNNVPQSQSVEAGLSNDTNTEIINGLKEGDKVITQTIASNTASTSSTNSSQSQNNRSFMIPGLGR